MARDTIAVALGDFKVNLEGNDRARVEFIQTYPSNLYRDTIRKTLGMIKVGGKWLINPEVSVPCVGNTVGGCKGK